MIHLAPLLATGALSDWPADKIFADGHIGPDAAAERRMLDAVGDGSIDESIGRSSPR